MSDELEDADLNAFPSADVTEHWFKKNVDRWVEKDGEFRQSLSRRYETIKLIGSGHGVGLVAIAAFLNAEKSPQGWALVGAKACWVIFGLGVLTFCMSYYSLYRFEGEIEKAIFLRRHGRKWDHKVIDHVVREAVPLIMKWRATVCSLVLLGIGMGIIFLGILFH